jgi:uncharacterized protein involved in exopolysaccharide biosynthesis
MAIARHGDRTRNGPGLVPVVLLVVSGVALLGLGVSTKFISWVSPQQFEATTTIRAEPFSSAESPTNFSSSEFYFLHTEFEVIRSGIILDRVIANLDLPHAWSRGFNKGVPLTVSDCRAMLKERMDSRIQRGTNVFELVVRSDDRTEAATIANAIADSYRDYRGSQRRERTTALTNAAQAQLSALNSQIETARESERKLKSSLKVLETAKPTTASRLPPTKSDAAIDKESQMINEVQTLAKLKAMNHEQLRNALPGISPDATLISLLRQLDQAELGLNPPASASNNGQAETIHAGTSVDELNQEINARIAGILLNMETHIAVLKDEIRNDNARSEATRQTSLQTAEKERPYFAARQEVRELEKRRQDLRAQSDALIKSAEIQNIEILDRATPPPEPASGNALLRPGVLIVGGLLTLTGLMLLIRSQQARLARP